MKKQGHPLPETFKVTNKKTGKSITFKNKHDQRKTKGSRYA